MLAPERDVAHLHHRHIHFNQTASEEQVLAEKRPAIGVADTVWLTVEVKGRRQLRRREHLEGPPPQTREIAPIPLLHLEGAVAELVEFDNYDKVVDYGKEGRVMLTTLTKEFFVPRFMERDEGVRERPSAKYPWDGVSGVKPFREFAATTTVGVY